MTKAEIVSNICDELGMDKLDVQTTVEKLQLKSVNLFYSVW